MPFLQEPNVHMTERCWYMLKKLNLSKEDVLWTFNHPDKKTRLQSAKAQYVYRQERNFADYGIGLNCFTLQIQIDGLSPFAGHIEDRLAGDH